LIFTTPFVRAGIVEFYVVNDGPFFRLVCCSSLLSLFFWFFSSLDGDHAVVGFVSDTRVHMIVSCIYVEVIKMEPSEVGGGGGGGLGSL